MRSIGPHNLSFAMTEQEVVMVVRDYLAQWRPEELAQLPSWCRPGKITDAEDVGDWAYELTKERVSSTNSQPLLTEMGTFFAHAAKRLSALDAAAHRIAQDKSTAV